MSHPGDCNNLSKKLTQNTRVALLSDLGATLDYGALGSCRGYEWVKERKNKPFPAWETTPDRGDDTVET